MLMLLVKELDGLLAFEQPLCLRLRLDQVNCRSSFRDGPNIDSKVLANEIANSGRAPMALAERIPVYRQSCSFKPSRVLVKVIVQTSILIAVLASWKSVLIE